MNKDVVYIEPEDDITDIIARIKAAKLKLVALVPPKKIGVLRSAVNTKLVAKAARGTEKVVVIVTTDPSLIKLAAAAQIPVAKNLQSRPKLPSEIIELEKEQGEQVIDENDFADEIAAEDAALAAVSASERKSAPSSAKSANTTAGAKKSPGDAPKAKSADQEITSDELEKSDSKDKKGKKGKKGSIPTLEKYRKWIIIGAVAFVLLVGFLIWAFVFAPAAKISVAIRTTSNNFSENVSFTTNSGAQKTSEGIFLLEKQSIEKTTSVEFTATGQKDVGEKASGTIQFGAYFDDENTPVRIVDGVEFTRGDYKYVVISGASDSWDGTDEQCENKGSLAKNGCLRYLSVKVEAVNSGENYNIGSYDSGWTTNADTSMLKNYTISNTAFSGGTSKVVTVVSQSDFDKAKEKLENQGKEDGKSELAAKFGSDMITIDSSLEVSTSSPTSTPGVNEEVGSGVTPKIFATTTYTMYGVDKTAVEDFVKDKTNSRLAQDQKIYAVDTPFFENFIKNDNSYTAKLKSSTKSGPKVTEEDVLEKSKGKKIGEVQSLLKSINGVSSVSVKTSFPWVSSVPNDPNKITIELKVEE